MNKLIILLFVFSCLIYAIGRMFRIMHWPWAEELYYAGIIGFVISVLMGVWLYFRKRKKI